MKALSFLFKTNNNSAALIARIMLGAVMFPHGAQKMLGWFGGYGFSGTMNFFTGTMHIPALFAFLAILAEFAGSIGLIFGAFSRVAAFGIASVMTVAILTTHAVNGFFMNWFGNQKGEGFEYHLLAIALALIVIIQGAGAASVDALVARRLEKSDGYDFALAKLRAQSFLGRVSGYPNAATRRIFITGGTGYIGSRLIPLLTERGHVMSALVRKGSESKLPTGAAAVVGDALKMGDYAQHVRGADTFVHLIGVAHPSPSKGKEFRAIDLVSIQVAVRAAAEAGIKHFIYLSVAQPAPMMKQYQAVRAEGEALLRASGMAVTFVRPWYVLGPGHRWPHLIQPFYWLCERLRATREGAIRLGLVTLPQMLSTLVWAVEHQPADVQILDVPKIKELGAATRS